MSEEVSLPEEGKRALHKPTIGTAALSPPEGAVEFKVKFVVKPKEVPQRTCWACGKKGDKSSLYRLVSNKSQELQFDLLGIMPGRGTYLCKDRSCPRGSLKRKRIESTLRTTITDPSWLRFVEKLENLNQ
ncbi:MAG: hypothetical protein CL749_07495 [Chloroflexi bacterium]|nr:hypothetical protein [Chloroflexota bacterium]